MTDPICLTVKFSCKEKCLLLIFKVPIAANEKDVCLHNASKSHSYHLKI